jgi:hypothetical protein
MTSTVDCAKTRPMVYSLLSEIKALHEIRHKQPINFFCIYWQYLQMIVFFQTKWVSKVCYDVCFLVAINLTLAMDKTSEYNLLTLGNVAVLPLRTAYLSSLSSYNKSVLLLCNLFLLQNPQFFCFNFEFALRLLTV